MRTEVRAVNVVMWTCGGGGSQRADWSLQRAADWSTQGSFMCVGREMEGASGA